MEVLGEKGQWPFALAQHTKKFWNVFFKRFELMLFFSMYWCLFVVVLFLETQQTNYGLFTGNPKYFISCCLKE